MSFAQGFASAFVPFIQQTVSNVQQYELDKYNAKIAEFKKQRKVYEDGVQNSQRLKEQAQLIVQSVPGAPPDAWKAVYNDLYMGRSIEAVRKDALEGGFNRRTDTTASGPMGAPSGMPGSPAGASPAVPMGGRGVADQMMDSGLDTTGQVPTKDSALEIEKGTEEDSVGFDFAKWVDTRAEERFMKSVDTTPEEIAKIRAGFKPSPYDTEFVLNPARTKDKDSTTLTAGKVSFEYANYAEAAASGDPAAVKAFEDFQNNRLPVLLKALKIGKEDKPMTYDMAWDALQDAKKSGDPARIQIAQAELQSQLEKQALRAAVESSPDMIDLISIDDQGNYKITAGRVRPTAEGTVLVDLRGNPLEGNWKPITKTERDREEALDKMTYKDRMEYQTEVSELASALDLVGQINDIVSSEDLILTRVAGGVADISSFFREVSSIGTVFKDLTSNGKSVSLRELNNELVKRNQLGRGQTLQDLANIDIAGTRFSNIAQLRSALDAKLILAAYRIAGLEGQQGQGLSDRDVARMQTLLSPSTNPEVFKENLASYTRDRVDTLEDRGRFFIESGRSFEKAHGYNPMKSLVTTLQDQIDRRPGAKKGYDFAMGTPTTIDRMQGQQQPAPQPEAQPAAQPAQAQPTPQAQQTAAPAPTGPVTITSDEEYQQLPSGTTFRGPDGVLRRKP